MLYNEELKIRFITDYKRSRIVSESSLIGMFKKTSSYEEEKGKDCNVFSKNEILEMYSEFNAKSVRVLENYNVYLKHYTAFCIYNKVCEENNYNSISKDILMGCINPETEKNKILTREQIDDIENELFNYTDKAIIECLWEGISGKSMEDLISLNRSMISEDKNYILLKGGRTVPLSEKLYYLLDKAFQEQEYICYSTVIKVKKMIGHDCLYKELDNAYTVDSEDKFFRWVYRRIQIYRKYIDMPMLTMKNIQASGLLYKIKLGMDKDNLSLREFLYSEKGKMLAQQYGYKLKSYVDVLASKFESLI